MTLSNVPAGVSVQVVELPNLPHIRQVLLTHGVTPGKTLRVLQAYTSQDLVLMMCNGRKLALRKADVKDIKVATPLP